MLGGSVGAVGLPLSPLGSPRLSLSPALRPVYECALSPLTRGGNGRRGEENYCDMQQRYSPAWLMPFSPERWPLMLFNRAAAISYRFVAGGGFVQGWM